MNVVFKAFLIVTLVCAVILTVTWLICIEVKPDGIAQTVLSYLMLVLWFLVCAMVAIGSLTRQYDYEEADTEEEETDGEMEEIEEI